MVNIKPQSMGLDPNDNQNSKSTYSVLIVCAICAFVTIIIIFILQGHLDIISNLFFKLDETTKIQQNITNLPLDINNTNQEPSTTKVTYNNSDHQIVPKTNTIPKIVWQTWKNKDVLSFSNMKRMRLKNPNWKFNLMTDDDVIQWFENTQDDIVQIAYKSYKLINPKIGAARADIWRYAIIWYYGGIYLDIDSQIVDFEAMYKLANNGQYGVVLSHEGNGYPLEAFKRKRIVQWCFMARPRHNLFANVIKLIYHTLTWDQPKSGISSSYKVNMHEVVVWHTGPVMIGRALDMTIVQDGDDDIRIYGQDYNGFAKFKVRFSPDEQKKYSHEHYDHQKGLFRLPMN